MFNHALQRISLTNLFHESLEKGTISMPIERQETHFGRTMVNFGEKSAKNTAIFDDFSPK